MLAIHATGWVDGFGGTLERIALIHGHGRAEWKPTSGDWRRSPSEAQPVAFFSHSEWN